MSSQDVAAASPRPTNKYYFLGLLTLLNVLLVLDKIVLTVVVEPIRAEFGLSDSQLGAIMGFVYAICMGGAAIPLGMLADRINRRTLAATCLVVWSGMTAVCGLAQNVTHLVLARIGVGVGEAGGGPASVSMISDMFDAKNRAKAMAVFAMGTQLAGLVTLTFMTQITHHYGWRVTLFVAAVPGLVLAAIMMLTTREPKRGASERRAAAGPAPSIAQFIKFVMRQRSLRHLIIGATLSYIVVAGMGSWHFTFLVRSHGLQLHVIGPWLGVGLAVGGLIGNLGSGYLADKFGARDERYRCWLIAVGAVVAVAVAATSLLWQTGFGAAALVAVFAGVAMFWYATTTALTQGLVQVRMRSTIAGLMFLLSNLIGYGLGPMLVGALSDFFEPRVGADSLRLAMLSVCVLNAWAAVHFFLAAKTLRQDLATARDSEEDALEAVKA